MNIPWYKVFKVSLLNSEMFIKLTVILYSAINYCSIFKYDSSKI
jgi:hypothetical protein